MLGTVGMLMGEGIMQPIPEHCSLREWLLPELISRAPARPARSALSHCREEERGVEKVRDPMMTVMVPHLRHICRRGGTKKHKSKAACRCDQQSCS